MKADQIFQWIELEIQRQDSLYGTVDERPPEWGAPPLVKRGRQPAGPPEWLALLKSEIGDVETVALVGRIGLHVNVREYQDQLLHVAAVAVAALRELDIDDEPGCLGEMNWGIDPKRAREIREAVG